MGNAFVFDSRNSFDIDREGEFYDVADPGISKSEVMYTLPIMLFEPLLRDRFLRNDFAVSLKHRCHVLHGTILVR